MAKRIEAQSDGVVHFIYHTVVRQYFDKTAERKFQNALDLAASWETTCRPFAHFAMEYDGEVDSAALRLSLWPEGVQYILGRADFHGRWVEWTGLRG